MSVKENDLGGGDLGAYDDVDIFGLNAFGEPGGIAPLYGAMLGSGVGTLAAIGVRSFKPEWAKYSEVVGLAAGVLAGGAMLVSPSTRYAGWVAMASAALSNGLRAVESYFRPTNGGFVLTGLGEQRVQKVGAFAGAGLGIQQAERLNGLGSGPMRGQRKMPSLMGQAFSKAAGHWGSSPILMNQ